MALADLADEVSVAHARTRLKTTPFVVFAKPEFCAAYRKIPWSIAGRTCAEQDNRHTARAPGAALPARGGAPSKPKKRPACAGRERLSAPPQRGRWLPFLHGASTGLRLTRGAVPH